MIDDNSTRSRWLHSSREFLLCCRFEGPGSGFGVTSTVVPPCVVPRSFCQIKTYVHLHELPSISYIMQCHILHHNVNYLHHNIEFVFILCHTHPRRRLAASTRCRVAASRRTTSSRWRRATQSLAVSRTSTAAAAPLASPMSRRVGRECDWRTAPREVCGAFLLREGGTTL